MAARTPRPTTVGNPADLLLRITRGPAGLTFTSPQLPNWSVVARGTVPVAGAVDAGFVELACAAYAARRGQRYDLESWDAAAEAFAASGHTLTADDVIIVRTDQARRASGSPVRRPMATNGPRHDPWDWTDLGNGYWQSPAGHRYPEAAQCVQRVIARRTSSPAHTGSAVQQTIDDIAS